MWNRVYVCHVKRFYSNLQFVLMNATHGSYARLFHMEQAIDQFVDTHQAWSVSGETLIGNWKCADFTELRQIVMKLCELAEELNHHPTVTYGYNTLRVETTTHDARNTITQKDIELATRISRLVGE